jgi:hypothetical protein
VKGRWLIGSVQNFVLNKYTFFQWIAWECLICSEMHCYELSGPWDFARLNIQVGEPAGPCRMWQAVTLLFYESEQYLSLHNVYISVANLCPVQSCLYMQKQMQTDRSSHFFIQVAPQLSSRGWVDPVPNPLFLRQFGRAGNRTRDLWICSQKLWPLDHRGGRWIIPQKLIISEAKKFPILYWTWRFIQCS